MESLSHDDGAFMLEDGQLEDSVVVEMAEPEGVEQQAAEQAAGDVRPASSLSSLSSPCRSSAQSRSPTSLSGIMTFELPSPEILRGAHAGATLRRFGAIFRIRGTEGSFARGSKKVTKIPSVTKTVIDPYALSFKVERIQDFWSHSWHANAVRKVATLLFVYNGLPAAVLGTCAALGSMTLSGRSVLPPMVHERSEDGKRILGYSVWSQCFGIATFVVVLLLWWSRRTVFLDKVCIHQTNLALKQQGVESIGGFLKHSDRMLVLWDESYARRLWCVFEMAAFVKTHEDSVIRNKLRVIPIDLGPVMAAFFLVTCTTSTLYMLVPPAFRLMVGVVFVLSFYPCARLLHRYSRSLNILHEDLQGFSVKSANCYCCSVGHRDPTSQMLLACDRKIVEKCIVQWFGDLQAFEEFVRTDLLILFKKQLGQHGFQYRWAVLAMTPLMWWQAETIGARWREGAEDEKLLLGLVTSSVVAWLCDGPVAMAVIMRLVAKLHWIRNPCVVDVTASAAGAVGGATTAWVVAMLEWEAWEMSLGAFVALLAIKICATVALYHSALSRRLSCDTS